MSKSEAPWPDAPKHHLSQNGTYFVTATGQDVWTKALAQLLGYEAYLSEILSRAIKLCASERGKTWAGACSEPISLVFGEMV